MLQEKICKPDMGKEEEEDRGPGDDYDSESAWQAWEEEMREYGCTQEEIDNMKAGKGLEVKGEEAPAEDTGSWQREVKRIFAIKRIASELHDTGSEGVEGEAGEGEEQKNYRDEDADGSWSSRKRAKFSSNATDTCDVAARLAEEDYDTLTKEKFWDQYMIPNLPVVVRGFVANARGQSGDGCAEDGRKELGEERGWRAWREWVTGDGRPDTMHLRENFGHVCVTVHNCARWS